MPYILPGEPPLEPNERIEHICPSCGYGIFNRGYWVDNSMICEECFEDWIGEHTPEQLAEKIGIQTEVIV